MIKDSSIKSAHPFRCRVRNALNARGMYKTHISCFSTLITIVESRRACSVRQRYASITTTYPRAGYALRSPEEILDSGHTHGFVKCNGTHSRVSFTADKPGDNVPLKRIARCTPQEMANNIGQRFFSLLNGTMGGYQRTAVFVVTSRTGKYYWLPQLSASTPL